MAKAYVTTSGGTKITLEGDPSEIAELIAKLEKPSAPESANTKASEPQPRKKPQRATPTTLIADLIEESFFNPPKDLNEVQAALEIAGHFYPVTSLSPALLRMVQAKQLRRLKKDKKWTYTR